MNVSHPLFQRSCTLLKSTQLSSKTYQQEYVFPELAKISKPGQFVQIRISSKYSPLLPRPFSILNVNANQGTLTVLFKIFGEATDILSRKLEGETVEILGPLGNTFELNRISKLFLVAGGVGIPPIYYLLQTIDMPRYDISLFLGAATKDDLFLREEFNNVDIEKSFSTDDGSYGTKTLVTVPLEDALKRGFSGSKACILSCGPMPMLAEVQRLAQKYKVEAQLSVETIMACGIGICQGCVVPLHGNTKDAKKYTLVCVDGPIYSRDELIL